MATNWWKVRCHKFAQPEPIQVASYTATEVTFMNGMRATIRPGNEFHHTANHYFQTKGEALNYIRKRAENRVGKARAALSDAEAELSAVMDLLNQEMSRVCRNG